MITITLIFVIFSIATLVYDRRSYKHGMHYRVVEALPFMLFVSVLLTALSIFPVAGVGYLVGGTHTETGYVPIHALADSSHTEGEFYLFGGSVDTVPVYRYYYRTEQGFRMGWVPAEDTWIVEEETDNPRLVIDKVVPDESLWYFNPRDTEKTYTFHVPHGTVVSSFELDLKDG